MKRTFRSQKMLHRAHAAAGLTLLLSLGCSGGTPPHAGLTGAGSDTTTTAGDTATGGADTGVPPQASCTGTVIQPAYAALDSQCAFLAECADLSNCYCGKGCVPGSGKNLCSAAICGSQERICSCGETCGADKKLCPQYICDPLDIKGCEPQDDCVYQTPATAPAPAWCGCQQMPDHAPDCWCGKCGNDHLTCDADKCTGKNPDKCIVVPGTPFTGCHCATCGLLGAEPKCFFVVCT